MTVRYGPDDRLNTTTHWRFPAHMRVELEHYLGLDAELAAGAGCAACGARLRYPLVELALGDSELLLHPGCAEEAGHALLDDVGVIKATQETV